MQGKEGETSLAVELPAESARAWLRYLYGTADGLEPRAAADLLPFAARLDLPNLFSLAFRLVKAQPEVASIWPVLLASILLFLSLTRLFPCHYYGRGLSLAITWLAWDGLQAD